MNLPCHNRDTGGGLYNGAPQKPFEPLYSLIENRGSGGGVILAEAAADKHIIPYDTVGKAPRPSSTPSLVPP